MTAAGTLARGRAAAEALMVDTCTIAHRTGSTTDDLTGETVATWETVYTGKCKIQNASIAQGQQVEAGELEPVLLRLELHLPIAGTSGIERGDRVTITTSTHDPDLAGRTLRVHDLSHKTWPTARRLGVQETT